MNWEGKERRKKIIVEKKIQLRHTALLVISFLFVLLLVEFHIYSLLKSMIPRIAIETDLSYLTGLGILIMIEMLVIIIIVGVINIVYTHRLVGPISRISKELEEMSEKNEYHHIKIRKKDELQGLVSSINKVIDSITKKQS